MWFALGTPYPEILWFVSFVVWDIPSLSFPLLSRDNLESYTSDYTAQVLVGYCMVYIFMQTFMIPGTVFMSLLAGSLFGVFRGVALVVFTATAGASSCYFLSKLIGRPLVFSLWPDKLSFFQAQVNCTLSACMSLPLSIMQNGLNYFYSLSGG